MKIVALMGPSGSGKTTTMKKLCSFLPNLYHPVMSYTDRPMREENEYGHTFISSEEMQDTLKSAAVVAETQIGDFFYCATEEQFREDKINLYIVDRVGLEELKYYFLNKYPDTTDICVVLFDTVYSVLDEERMSRDVDFLPNSFNFKVTDKLETDDDMMNISYHIMLFFGGENG